MLAYVVAQRTHEIGIRIALGALPQVVLRQLLASGMGTVALGAALGLAVAFWASRFLSSLLFGISARDPLTYAGVLLGLGAVALLANAVPASRAATIDPARALRCD